MSIKIDLPGSNPLRPASPVKSSSTVSGTSSNQPVSATAAGDQLRLTGDAINRQQIDQALAAVPKVDAGRVERLKAAVSDGSYKPNPAAIAAKFARFEWDLAPA
ncbi:flagellar biosynthesis anti-sigma factor FlgM [Nevskia sp.]|uniref:flagellar biosynthesis anti-sigma factor FlgM n=1 Tax=Nevskia sp. TaxID=1929292 RepID=UPI0025DB884F|nr:flagellar biosynthesis anti-sigma factor FlgM [Nevskia sp.]